MQTTQPFDLVGLQPLQVAFELLSDTILLVLTTPPQIQDCKGRVLCPPEAKSPDKTAKGGIIYS